MREDAAAPAVSVIVPFLDVRAFLPDAIESVLAQTFPDWELLLIDDGSTDESSEIARDYARRCPGRILYLEHPGHGHCARWARAGRSGC